MPNRPPGGQGGGNGQVEIFGNLSDKDVLVKNASDEIKEGAPLQQAKE